MKEPVRVVKDLGKLACTQCEQPIPILYVAREVMQLDPDQYEGLSEGQAADYEMERAMGGGDNWTERVEYAKCRKCHAVVIRRTLDGTEITDTFLARPSLDLPDSGAQLADLMRKLQAQRDAGLPLVDPRVPPGPKRTKRTKRTKKTSARRISGGARRA